MSQSQRLHWTSQFFDFVAIDAERFQSLADFCRILRSIEHNVMEVSTGQQNEDSIKTLVQPSGR